MGRSRFEPRTALTPAAEAAASAPAAVESGAGNAPAPLPLQGAVAVDGPALPAQASVFAGKADGGLGRPAERTWSALKAAGREIAMEELCQATGFAPRTTARHLQGLARHGLAVHGEHGDWVGVGLGEGVPQPRPENPAPVAR
ncbi:hypothetical protein [Streptomyces sp. NPDC048606]|uniref:hypothetical protein n=1 Tax=Streptomyces sp. NPDC048606 TaxID=3154726 RepID=UPI003448940F